MSAPTIGYNALDGKPGQAALTKLTALWLITCLAFAGCGLPRDPEGTLDRASGGTMRAEEAR